MRPTGIAITAAWIGMLFLVIVLIGPADTVIENLISATLGLIGAIATVITLDRINK